MEFIPAIVLIVVGIGWMIFGASQSGTTNNEGPNAFHRPTTGTFGPGNCTLVLKDVKSRANEAKVAELLSDLMLWDARHSLAFVREAAAGSGRIIVTKIDRDDAERAKKLFGYRGASVSVLIT